MKHARTFRNWLLTFCVAAALLCGLLTLSASAAELSPNEIQVTLTWDGVDTSVESTVSNGAVVTAGNLTFYEDGIQQTFNGSGLIPIDASGTTIISYAFDPAKTYTITVEEKAEAPYYMTKDIVLSADDVTTAINTGLAINETVEWIQWSKPVKISLVDSTGAPVSVQGVNVSLYGTDISGGFFGAETRATNASGVVSFPTRSYCRNDSSMTTIDSQILFTAQYPSSSGGSPTTIARVFELSANAHNGQDPSHKRHNEVELAWPSATVSGTVYTASGTRAANTRVAAYYALPTRGRSFAFVDYDYSQNNKLTQLRLNYDLCVYYTTTDASGNYTLALPAGPVDICAGDSSPNNSGIFTQSANSALSPAKYYKALIPHFPWLSVINVDSPKLAGVTSFEGVYCQERPSLTLNVTDEDMAGQDLRLDTSALNGYYLTGNVTVNGEALNDTLSLRFSLLDSSNPPSDFHSGSYNETYLYVSTANGRIDKNYVNLAPGNYTVSCNTKFEIADGYSVYPSSTRVTVPSDSAYNGQVDLGTLNFIIASRPTSPSGTSPATKLPGPIQYTPIPSRPPYAHLSTQIEAIPDPAYGPFAYQFTVHYCGNYTGSGVTQLDGCKLEITYPSSADILSPGQFSNSTTTRKLTIDLPTLEVGKPYSTTFTADIKRATGDVTLTVYSSPNHNDNGSDDTVLKPSSAITLNRPRITLNGPRAVNAGDKFRVFGNAAGTDGTGIVLYKDTDTPIATGANKGRYYYFNVGGQAAGDYKLFARTQRFSQQEDSTKIDVTVVEGDAIKVEDAYIMRGSKRTDINANFGMIYYTAFIAYDKHVPAFDLYFKLSQAPAEGEAVSLDIGGLSFAVEAPNDGHPGYYKASINDLYATGEQSVLLKVGDSFTTQLACLMLVF